MSEPTYEQVQAEWLRRKIMDDGYGLGDPDDHLEICALKPESVHLNFYAKSGWWSAETGGWVASSIEYRAECQCGTFKKSGAEVEASETDYFDLSAVLAEMDAIRRELADGAPSHVSQSK